MPRRSRTPSVLDMSRSLLLQGIEAGPHRLELLGRVTDPVEELTNDAQRFAAAERLRWIPGEPLVGEVGVVLELPQRLDDVDAPTTLTGGELGAPDRGVERCGEVDVVHQAARLEVRFAPGHQQLADRKVCLRAMQVHARLVHLEGHRLPHAAHTAMLLSGAARADGLDG